MNLNDYRDFSKLDSQNMLAEIQGLPDQLQRAWEEAAGFDLTDQESIKGVVIAGMGGSAIGADLLKAYTAPLSTIPLELHRGYGLPAWASGPETLVIASSHSGNTEETISALEAALMRNCRVVVVTTGGRAAELACKGGVDLWKFDHSGQPRAAVGYYFALLLKMIARLGFIPDPGKEIQDAVQQMTTQQELLDPELPVHQNPAKRLAGQLIDRWVSVFGADLLAPVARRWKGQISEVAKAWGQYEDLPEADHNTLAGVVNPEEILQKTVALFLKGTHNHPRNQRRIDLTKKNFMLEGISTDLIEASGISRLAQMWSLIQFGDYTAYYLAMAYDMDPTPVPAIENFKQEL